MPRIIVSAGHTNEDPGILANGLREVDLTRAIAKRLVPYLRANGVITLSVPPNLDVARRIEWINGTGYSEEMKDISIEIHINKGVKSGFEFWYKGKGSNSSQDLAEMLMQTVTQDTGFPNAGVRSELEHEYGSLAFISNTKTISVILECLNIENVQDAQKLSNAVEVDKISKGIAKGVLRYLNIPFKDPRSATPINPQLAERAKAMASTAQNTNPVQQQVFQNQAQAQQPPVQTPMNRSYPSFSNDQMPNSGMSFNGNRPMSREERQEMINTVYKKILGREPNQNDLNYFLNVGIPEDKLIKRMMESQEHLDMVKSRGEFDTMKKKFEDQKIELVRLKAQIADSRVIFDKLKQLLIQKNKYIGQMRAQIQKLQQMKSAKNEEGDSGPKYKGKLSDRVFHFFSGVLG